MSGAVIGVFVVVWVVVGLATGLWMARRGHDPLWTVVAVILGPLFVPIARERVERRPRLAATGTDGAPAARGPGDDGLRVLVGLDGSPESDRALDATVALLGGRCSALVLAEVASYDDTDGPDGAVREAARRLTAAAARVTDAGHGTVVTEEVLAGPAAEALQRVAADQDMDLLVVGRRGHGMSTRLLGSVSAHLIRHAGVPILISGPGRVTARDTARARDSAPAPATP